MGGAEETEAWGADRSLGGRQKEQGGNPSLGEMVAMGTKVKERFEGTLRVQEDRDGEADSQGWPGLWATGAILGKNPKQAQRLLSALRTKMSWLSPP